MRLVIALLVFFLKYTDCNEEDMMLNLATKELAKANTLLKKVNVSQTYLEKGEEKVRESLSDFNIAMSKAREISGNFEMIVNGLPEPERTKQLEKYSTLMIEFNKTKSLVDHAMKKAKDYLLHIAEINLRIAHKFAPILHQCTKQYYPKLGTMPKSDSDKEEQTCRLLIKDIENHLYQSSNETVKIGSEIHAKISRATTRIERLISRCTSALEKFNRIFIEEIKDDIKGVTRKASKHAMMLEQHGKDMMVKLEKTGLRSARRDHNSMKELYYKKVKWTRKMVLKAISWLGDIEGKYLIDWVNKYVMKTEGIKKKYLRRWHFVLSDQNSCQNWNLAIFASIMIIRLM